MIKDFQIHINKELLQLEKALIHSVKSDVDLATEVSFYILKSGGKRIRPTIAILIAYALGYKGKELITLSSAIELLHTATLIHDDVVDESDIRRGKKSIHKKWDNAHGVLVGDFVYSKAFQLMASLNNKEIIKTLANSTNKISEGEVLQLKLIESNKLREEDYYEIIGRKTAELFKASALSAALLSDANNKLVEASGNFAFSLGMVFQLRDDLLDYSGNKEITGKITGKDFMEGKVTLPLIKAFEFSSPKDLKFLNEAFKRKDRSDLEKIINLFNECGSIEYVENITEEYSKKCLDFLSNLPDSHFRDSLKDIVLNMKKRIN